jgi:hypothetical protein
MKKTPTSRVSKSKAGTRSSRETWHGGSDIEFRQYARSLQNAAKVLVGKLDLDRSARNDWDACPVVLLYRQALETNLKMLVGEGSKFLPSPTDHITLFKAHSLRWLAQIVCQIIRKIGWESEFKCEGASSLVEFTALVYEVECCDPVSRGVRHSRTGDPQSVSQYFQTSDILQFAKRLDALLDLLGSTTDALAAEWDQRAAALAEFDGGDFKPTIQ